MVPLQPQEPAAARRGTGVGVEVRTGDRHLDAAAAIEWQAHDLVDMLRVGRALPDAHVPLPIGAEPTVRVTVGTFWAHEDRLGVAGSEAPQPEVSVIGVHTDAVLRPPGGSPVGVHPTANVRRGRRHLADRTAGTAAHQDGATLRRGPRLGPPQVSAIGHHRGDAHTAGRK